MLLKHSVFRSLGNPMSTIHLPQGLKTNLNVSGYKNNPLVEELNRYVSFADPGNYSVVYNQYNLEKIRGELSLANQMFHFEMLGIYFDQFTVPIPYSIRLWDHSDSSKSIEFLVSEGLIKIRDMWFNACINVSGIFLQILTALMSHFDLRIDGTVGSLLGDQGVTVVPNLSEMEFSHLSETWINNLNNGSPVEFNQIFMHYCNKFGIQDLIQLILTSRGEFHRSFELFQHPGTFVGHNSSNFEIASDETYNVLREIVMIPYDHWQVVVYPESQDVQVKELDTMAGYNFPLTDYEMIIRRIEGCLIRLTDQILPSVHPIDGAWYEHMGEVFPVSHLEFRRTMDEQLEISIYMEEPDDRKFPNVRVISLGINLVLLTMLSPTVILSTSQPHIDQLPW